ncbi:MAG TPA: hypothetical protein DEP84_32425 [Chloroflexi bacterium]|nr:hypothetical protein [Chloroflexota bacterium]
MSADQSVEGSLSVRVDQFTIQVAQFFASLPKRGEVAGIATRFRQVGLRVGELYYDATDAVSSSEYIMLIEAAIQQLDAMVEWLKELMQLGAVDTSEAVLLLQDADTLDTMLREKVKEAQNRD